MHKAWVLLNTMAAQLKGVVSIPDRTAALVVGARSFLEQSYQQYIRSKLQEHRSQVRDELLQAAFKLLADYCAHRITPA